MAITHKSTLERFLRDEKKNTFTVSVDFKARAALEKLPKNLGVYYSWNSKTRICAFSFFIRPLSKKTSKYKNCDCKSVLSLFAYTFFVACKKASYTQHTKKRRTQAEIRQWTNRRKKCDHTTKERRTARMYV